MAEMWDVFISHASEDKDAVARPLAEALKKRGLRVWYDEFTLKLGDNLRRTIDRGLSKSTYGIVILSKSFFAKNWPQKELDGLDAREKDNKKVILPIWHEVSKEEVEQYSPMLAGRLAVSTDEGIDKIVDKILDVTGKPSTVHNTNTPQITDKIVRIKAEKDSFLIGRTIKISGVCSNCGDYVHLWIYGPGQYAKGVEIAKPHLSYNEAWMFEWCTDSSLLPGIYTFHVNDSENTESDEVEVKAVKGQLSIQIAGTGSYYLGDKIKFLGICLAGKKIYLSVKGPNAEQLERKLDNLQILCINNNPETFVKVDVKQDNTWSYFWDTSNIASFLDTGLYRIYASEGPFTSDNLFGKSHGIGMINIKLPFINGTVSQNSIAKGDRVFITGTSTGVRNKELLIWIFGDTFTHIDKIYVNPDSSYSYEIPPIITKTLIPGSYVALVQHPMMNNEFDIYFDDSKSYVRYNYGTKKGNILFLMQGASSLHGFDAFNALVQSFGDPLVDDIYEFDVFQIENPEIWIEPINDTQQGEKITIVSTTNLSVGNQILIELEELPSDITRKKFGYQYSNFSLGISVVIKGDPDKNKIALDLDTSTIKPGEYLFKESAMDIDVKSSVKFKVIEKK